MYLTKFYSILLIFGIHLTIGLLVYCFTSPAENIPVKQGGEIFLGDKLKVNPGLMVMPSAKNRVFFIYPINELTERVLSYPYLNNARAVIIMIGADENALDADNFPLLLRSLPPSTPVVWFAVPPTDSRVLPGETNAEIKEINLKFKKLCAAESNCSFVDLTEQMADADGNLKSNYHTGDGVSFSPQATQVWLDAANSLIP